MPISPQLEHHQYNNNHPKNQRCTNSNACYLSRAQSIGKWCCYDFIRNYRTRQFISMHELQMNLVRSKDNGASLAFKQLVHSRYSITSGLKVLKKVRCLFRSNFRPRAIHEEYKMMHTFNDCEQPGYIPFRLDSGLVKV